ncbi:MAG: hypothetical protein JNJ40_07930 [Bacteroidia bacterium]|nr:hypothetical protein [Bacteroidia bacterium]
MKEKYLIVKGCAGLGNRLVTVMAAIRYCQISKRTLIVDWADGQFDVKGENAFNKCFNISDAVKYELLESIKNWDNLSHSSELFKINKLQGIYDIYLEQQTPFFYNLPVKLFPKGRLRRLRKKWKPKKANYESLSFGGDLKNDLKEDVVYFVDFLPEISYNEMPEYIELKPEVKKEIEEFRLKKDLNNVTGVHVRYTDKKPTQKIEILIEHLKKKQEENIFLATDSAYIEDLFVKAFSNVILFPKIKPELSGEGLHQWALYNNEDNLKYIIYKESVIEMFLLSECKELFYQGNSTFSNISKTYHHNKKKCLDWQKL